MVYVGLIQGLHEAYIDLKRVYIRGVYIQCVDVPESSGS